MRFTRQGLPGAGPHRGQGGWSLVESVIAVALLGITAVVGITAWDTAILGAQQGTRTAWARCLARSELEAVLASPDGSVPSPLPTNVSVDVEAVPNATAGKDGSLKQVTVSVDGPGPSTAVIYRVTALKARALAGSSSLGSSSATDIGNGCPQP